MPGRIRESDAEIPDCILRKIPYNKLRSNETLESGGIMYQHEEEYKRAVLWEAGPDGSVQCQLCAWRCRIASGQTGRCRVRKNIGGVLVSLNYGKLCAANPDPIEKKPLFHFQPGSRSFSIAAPGCNFQCVFCQNWQISQMPYSDAIEGAFYSPKAIVDAAVRSRCSSVAYTYTEPTIFMELCADTAQLTKQMGLANVFVSNGYLSREAIEFVRPWLDGINIDLKAFREEFYRTLCKARLEPVKETIRTIAHQTEIWMEITTLVVPGWNDSEDELKAIADFIAEEASVDVPWHISRFYPQYQMEDIPPTPPKTLERAYEIGRQAGLRYVYIGNLPGVRAESTYCYNCGALLIEREGYTVKSNVIEDGACPRCGAVIAGFGL
ncbi:MAG TPA: AmmeMemoRadiSam system radical SAM enzyme [Anaerohalosphaeraceae bacterium]|nr:AmmeMemoRadiSam system radical SAM enzyme [Anaerohalosphaeraceae bacterium]HQG05794.1 AmmeMemoRadiSam system radical SAM enzyme [Anaerohalosphaeraceae bacterium]HQI06641.1 AmmeMemoRadiSam system radical SAM enzyme [Anaerohalosphaeraceae bacterium]HQJ67481.1 AmmeMemoRadiSam system radical SAM enzyme [Anaerohalosphaeraceae bacterium]